VHLPTGARLTVTSDEEPPACSQTSHEHGWKTRGWPTADVPLLQQEIDDLASLPPRSPDRTELLAALWSRLCVRDPEGRWAIGTWWSDPLPHRPWRDHGSGNQRRLWGTGEQWTLEWRGYPYEDDLIQALTDPAIGKRRCRPGKRDGYNELRLGEARLCLKPHV
jgi:hypothetical protein